MICAVNAQTGFESTAVIAPAEQPRRILVVGGGPAGMEAARVACLRGHQVTLCERSRQLGGTLFFAAIPYEPNGRLVDYLAGQIRKLPIDLRLGTEVTESVVDALAPDAVVVASGALREAPPVPGADLSHVFSGDELREMMTGEGVTGANRKLGLPARLLMGGGSFLGITRNVQRIRRMSRWWMPVGRRVAVVGGGLVGLELAEFLIERGREVTVLEEAEKFGAELSVVRRWRVLHGLRSHGAVLINRCRLLGIEPRSLRIATAEGEADIDADTVILATGARPSAGLAADLEARGIEVHLAGDCAEVGYIQGAMHSGHRIGRAL